MKVRYGFVSNSSSSSFVIAFTRDKMTPEIKQKAIDEYLCYKKEDMVVTDLMFATAMDILCDDGIITAYDCDSVAMGIADAIGQTLIRKYIIAEIQGGPDECGTIVNIMATELQNKVKELLK